MDNTLKQYFYGRCFIAKKFNVNSRYDILSCITRT